ncbi:MAG TPA: hypothetical protein DCG69_03900 [Bacteroidales bacterium]|nr:hypothetical protein [Bacteroidales bacterium]
MNQDQINILIVEDEVLVLQSLVNIVSRRYPSVFFAKDAQKALEIFEKEDIDLVITDIRMPGMDGISMLKRMQSEKPNIHRLVMSAYTEADYFLQAIEIGVEGYIVKPFMKEKVLEAIEKALKRISGERIAEKNREQLSQSEKQLRELNEAKDKFFSIIGHDIKTPVSTIASYSSLIIEDFDELEKEELIEFLKIIQKSSIQALDLLKNILEWARTQTGSLAFHCEILNICDIIQEEVEFSAHQCKRKEIQVDYSPRNDNFVFADRNMTRTVFRNLLSNAIKFTPQKGNIKLFSEHLKQGKGFVKISIRDNGVGIPKHVLPNLFSLKESYSSEGTGGEKGTGMGLLFCKEFIDIQGGKIEVESSEGIGTTFSFSLPAAKRK